ncbi:MAG: pilus assembly protein PilM, partial [Deltaproteobacteria bacterium]|nr:pilus assembly protein PilM [Deltaproteobacteria bacterium]
YANYPDHSLAKIVLSGGSAKIAGLSDILRLETDIPVEIFDPFARIDVDPDRFDPEYISQVGPQAAIAIGLALRSVET